MKKEKGERKKGRKALVAIAIVFGFLVIVNLAAVILSDYADIYLGRGEALVEQAEGTEDWDSQYYKSDYEAERHRVKAAQALVETIEEEGIVLLKNNGSLPLDAAASGENRITLFGRDAADPIFGGAGSGSVDVSKAVDLQQGLVNAGFQINPVVYGLLEEYASYKMVMGRFGMTREYENPRSTIKIEGENTYYIGEMPVDNYSDEAIRSFTDYDDAAVIVIGRPGGEGGDLARDLQGFEDNYTPGQHQLELNKDERDMIALAKENFDKVIVLLNSSNAMELGDLQDDDDVDAIVWIGSPGLTGFNAVGRILNGSVNPSGRLSDIYPRDFTQDPTFVNFGDFQYRNVSKENASGDAFFVQYEEGIYYGYRYYETAAVEGFLDYDDAVVYPFGFGLSYTDFAWELAGSEMGDVEGKISVDVKVTNTGNRFAGKEVVQLYYSPPYYEGGIEKAEVVLGAFAKTDLLEPGESQVVTLTFDVEDMASYDYKNAGAYVLEAGDYVLRLQRDSHNIDSNIDEMVYAVEETVVYGEGNSRKSDEMAAVNRFDDVSAPFIDGERREGAITNMTRSDFAGTFPTAPQGEDFMASQAVIKDFQPYDVEAHINEDAEMPVTGADNGLSLINMRGLDFDDPLWQVMLDQLDPEVMAAIVKASAFNTAAIESIGKPATLDYDGPAGLSALMGDLSGTAFPSEVVIASSFNTDMAYQMGRMVGEEGLASGVSGWYAPGLNMHRSPFAGRNFEYYSEDPLHSGQMGAAAVSGAADKGVYSYMKHYALNDQETNRMDNGLATWANEQAIREIYLKPFEEVVKEARTTVRYIADADGSVEEREMSAATAMMSAFNRIGAVWTGGSIPLMQTVLRDEWGFTGMVISDFNLYDHMDINHGLRAGTDINISMKAAKSMKDTSSASAVQDLRRAGHRMLFTVAHSNAMNGIVPGTTVTYTMAPWAKVLIAVDIILTVFLGLLLFMVLRKRKQA